MRKTHMKLGSLIVMTCLFLGAGMFMGVGNASAQHVQAAKKFHHWSAQAPHITVRMLPSTAAHHASRFVISGVGFNSCCTPAPSSYNSCNNSCGTTATTSATSSDTCSNATCSSSTSQTSSTDTNVTTTTITTTTTSPSTTTYTVTPSTTCSSATCSNSAPTPSDTYPTPAPSDTCPTTCSYAASTPSDTCPTTCSYAAPTPSDTYPTPAPSTTCPSYDPCGNTVSSSTDCSCSNTVDLQSSAPLSASGINLSRLPVNAFGEFNVTVNLQPRRVMTRHYTMPTIWAINSYNEQPSNYASVPCSCSSCCQ